MNRTSVLPSLGLALLTGSSICHAQDGQPPSLDSGIAIIRPTYWQIRQRSWARQ
jgi:hypothetical protein